MKRIHKKIIAGFLPLPLLLAITFCCCSDEKAFAEESHLSAPMVHHQETQSQELEKAGHSEHQDRSRGDHECTCPKHLSFLSSQSADIVFNSAISQMLAKNFMSNLRLDNVVFLAALPDHSQGPPLQDRSDHVSLPIYLKLSILRI